MSNDPVSAKVVDESKVTRNVFVTVKSPGSGNGDGIAKLKEFLRGLPSDAVKDLLSLGACVGCTFRIFGFQGHNFQCLSLSSAILSSIFEEPTNSDKNVGNSKCELSHSIVVKESEELEYKICNICMGILQFTFYDDNDNFVKKESSKDFAVWIADMIKREGHQIDGLSIEVSLPSVVLENDHSVWVYMKTKYANELWFQEKDFSKCTTTKDTLKLALVNHLENMLDSKSSISSLRVRLTYSHTKASERVEKFDVKPVSCKRRKAGEAESVEERFSNRIPLHKCSDFLKLLTEEDNNPCHLSVLCYRTTPIYFGGRYLKYSRNVSQSRWIVDDERMGETSVEEIIGSNILPMCCADSYKFHAAGREDIDVRMLGTGRPFLVEIQNARCVPPEVTVKDLETKINSLETKLVNVKNLKIVGSEGWSLMREGEAEKQKRYVALVWISRPLKAEDLDCVSSLKDLKIVQRTPVRVLHRRSPLEREKIVHWMKIEKLGGSSQYFLLHLCTQAGTYIKEFVHGDLGRTQPSIGSILGCRAEILQLDVTEVKMECFLS